MSTLEEDIHHSLAERADLDAATPIFPGRRRRSHSVAGANRARRCIHRRSIPSGCFESMDSLRKRIIDRQDA